MLAITIDDAAITFGESVWLTAAVKRDPVLDADITTHAGDMTVITPIRIAANAMPGPRTIKQTIRT